MKKIFIIFFLVTILFTHYAYAQQAGDLDSSFGINGKVVTTINGVDDRIFAIALQIDGKIIVGGSAKVGNNSDFVLGRYLSNGSPDISFGVNGFTLLSISDSTDIIRDIKILHDGKIIVVGECFTGTYQDVAIARFDSTGIIDSSYANNGILKFSVDTGDDFINSIILNNENIYMSVTNYTNVAIIKIDKYGSFDNTFGVNGIFYLPPQMRYVSPLKFKGLNKILGGGYTNISNTDFAVICIDTLGVLDTTFGLNGIATTDFASSLGEQVNSLGLLSDSSIIAGGGLDFTGGGSNWDFALSKYSSNGIVDSTFGINGKVVTSLSNGRDILMKILIQPDDKIIAVGYSSGNTDFALVRYNSNGTLDNTFGNNGVVITDFLFNSDLAYAAILQSDLKILAAGTARSGNTWNFGLARYLSGLNVGILEFKNEQIPLLIYPNPVLQFATISYTLNQNQKITMSLHDLTGRNIKIFMQSESKTEGEHTEYLYFDKGLKAGVYILKIDDGNASRSIKIIKN